MNSHYLAIKNDKDSPRIQAVCDHVLRYKESHLSEWRKLYEVLYGHYITFKYEESVAEKANLKCEICKTRQRIHACMDCIHFACLSAKHIHDHAKDESHLIAFDTTFGCIYCFECKDYQYDSEFEEIALMLQIEARTSAHYRANIYEPTQELLAFVRDNKNVNLHNVSTTHLGLRGIINLGSSTCFIGCMLQVLFHAPVFRNYLLSNKHNNCPQNQCLLQKMSVAAQEFFSASEEAYVPSNFYYEIYQKLQMFAGCDQNDVMHFLSDLLRVLHCHDTPCNCFIGKVFESLAEYTLVCSKCGNKKIQEIPFQCIFYSFEKYHPVEYSENNEQKKFEANNLENLQWTTALEDIKEKCCKQQLEIKGAKKKKMPIIISFVNNMFEPNQKEVRISMKYPKVIDIRKLHLLISLQPPNLIKPVVTEDSKFVYYLFAIVTYAGNGKLGHYCSYIKQHNNWFRCNNEDIVEVLNTENICKNEVVYALFYHKQVLDYEMKIENSFEKTTTFL